VAYLLTKVQKGNPMPYLFTVAGGPVLDLDDIAKQLREQISTLPPNEPQLAKQELTIQTGVVAFLEVVRGNETPHTHPESDLIFSVLEGGGYVELLTGIVSAPAGTTVVIPKGMCHAYYNTAETDSVLLATFSPAIPDKGECAES
jgi:mannose-6-phosphate isomerase-like protein (cupin superfamily)